MLHSSGIFVRSYANAPGLRCISYTKRAADPVISSGCQVVPGRFKSSSPVLFSLALSLALASSGICNSLQKSNLELEAGVGIGQISSLLHLKYA
jgi:hypothetical protein